eukprot:6313790-Prymnesium_polylepis.1
MESCLAKDWYWALVHGGIFAKYWNSIGRLASYSPRVAVGKYEQYGEILSRVVDQDNNALAD